MYGYNKKSDNERYLEDELERAKRHNEKLILAEQQRRDDRMREIREQSNQYCRTASNWREAIRKQKRLFDEEVALFPGTESDYIADGSKACERALELWPEYEGMVSQEIKELEAKIQQLKDSIRFNIGKQLLKEGKSSGWVVVANELQDKDLDCEEWLNW